MSLFEYNIDGQSINGLLSAAVRIQRNDVTWSEALSIKQTHGFASWIAREELYAHFGMPNEFIQDGNEVHIMLVNTPIAACVFDRALDFRPGRPVYLNLNQPMHYSILADVNPALRRRFGNALLASYQGNAPTGAGIEAWLDFAPSLGMIPSFESAFSGLRPQTIAPRFDTFLGLEADQTNDGRSGISVALESPLAATISKALADASLDDDARQDAQKAADEARAFANRELSADTPRVMIADDGTVMLQWRDTDRGVLLVFTGDGTASYSIKRAGGLYATSREEFSLKDQLPPRVRSAINDIIGLK
jgi:hypothetical protein